MKNLQISLLVCCCFVLFCTMTPVAQQQQKATDHSHGPHKGHELAKDTLRSEPVRLSIPDVEILTHDGKKQRLFTDLVKGKRVVINFI